MNSTLLTKVKVLAGILIAAATLSVLGSILTLVTIFRRDKHKRNTVYTRLLIGTSVLDLAMSCWFMFGPLPLPRETGLPGAKGTVESCTAYGFFRQFGFGTFGYSMCLMIYYVMVIRYNIKDERIAKVYEPFMHAGTLIFFLGTAIAGLPLTLFNPTYPICGITAHPFKCDTNPNVECDRGIHADICNLLFFVIPSLVIYTTILVCLGIVSWTVWRKGRSSREFDFAASISNPNLQRQASSSRRLSKQDKQTRQVQTQCILYAITFLNSLMWILIVRFFHIADQEGKLVMEQFWTNVMVVLFYPSQGFFNCLIFIRPRYLSVREQCSERGRWWAFKEAIWNPTAKYKRRSTSSGLHFSSSTPGDSKRSMNPATGGKEGSNRCNVAQEKEEDNVVVPSEQAVEEE